MECVYSVFVGLVSLKKNQYLSQDAGGLMRPASASRAGQSKLFSVHPRSAGSNLFFFFYNLGTNKVRLVVIRRGLVPFYERQNVFCESMAIDTNSTDIGFTGLRKVNHSKLSDGHG